MNSQNRVNVPHVTTEDQWDSSPILINLERVFGLVLNKRSHQLKLTPERLFSGIFYPKKNTPNMSRFYIRDDVFKKTLLKASIGLFVLLLFTLLLTQL